MRRFKVSYQRTIRQYHEVVVEAADLAAVYEMVDEGDLPEQDRPPEDLVSDTEPHIEEITT